jgi:hypothetical protein
MVRAALRRFLIVFLLTASLTAAASLLLGFLAAASISRSVSLGFYAVGSFLLVAGFAFGNRGPARPKGEGAVPLFGSRMLRWATREEGEEALNTSAIFVALGFLLIVLGVLADTRYEIL